MSNFAYGVNRSILSPERSTTLGKDEPYERIHNQFLLYSPRAAVDVVVVLTKLEEYDKLILNWQSILKNFHAIILLDEVNVARFFKSISLFPPVVI